MNIATRDILNFIESMYWLFFKKFYDEAQNFSFAPAPEISGPGLPSSVLHSADSARLPDDVWGLQLDMLSWPGV
jgi:hypothetical protein